MSRVLVSGGAGFIGFALGQRLAQDPSCHVYLVDNFIRGDRDQPLLDLVARPNVELVECDLASPEALEALPDGPMDCVYHLAALNGTQNFYERPTEVMRCSTLSTFTLLEAYGKRGDMGRFVYAGTSESYASTVSKFDWPVPTDEEVPLSIDDPRNPRWSYAASKIHGEVLTIHACREFGKPYSIIRYHNVYGPRMGDRHVIPDFVERMAQGVYSLYGHAETRSFMYVDDAVDATIAVAQSEACANEIVNVGSDEEMTMLELAKHILRVSGREAEIELHDAPEGCVKRRLPEVGKLKRLTGFEPRTTLDAGLSETVRFYLERAQASS